MATEQSIGSVEGLIMKDKMALGRHCGPVAEAQQAAGSLELCEPILVVGIGATGLSCIRFLTARGFDVRAVDSAIAPAGLAELRREFPLLPLTLGSLDQVTALETGTLVLSPGVWAGQEAVQAARRAGVEVLGDIELFARAMDAPVVAITGSNGKSTVTTLIAHMLAAAEMDVRAGGNLGPPALDLLSASPPDCYVLELSSFQLETTISLRATVATVLNLSPDHMDRYASFDDYVSAKASVYAGEGAMVINRDDARVAALAQSDRRVVSYGLDAPEEQHFGVREVQGKRWLAQGHMLLARCDALPLPGMHNISNALAALAVGESLGLSMVATIGALLDFKGLRHRCELVADDGSVRWINDSKGTNVGAVCAAIEGLGDADNLILLAGGEGKDADFAPLVGACKGRVRTAVLFGRDAQRIGKFLESAVEVQYVQTLNQAVINAAQLARSGDTVLFSPACASFDMFKNYAERGDAFSELVQEVTAS